MTNVNSCLYLGHVHHHRQLPRVHSFGFSTYFLLLDLSELPTLFRRNWLWSVDRPAVARFKPQDHLKGFPETLSLRDRVTSVLDKHGIVTNIGSIRLLTQLRYMGFVMNPISFFYCYDSADEYVAAVIVEVNNTPWGEQHVYVVPGHPNQKTISAPRVDKEFHVSPFMPMSMFYRMRFSSPANTLGAKIDNFLIDPTLDPGSAQPVFQTSLRLNRRPLTNLNLAWVFLRYPLISWQIFVGIYWQAIRLYLKRLPIFKHSKSDTQLSVSKGELDSVEFQNSPENAKSKAMAG